VSAPRAIPTSRAYWELQAEKLMNRIFDPEEAIDLDPQEPGEISGALAAETLPTGHPTAHPTAEAAPRRRRARRPSLASATPPAEAAAPQATPMAASELQGRSAKGSAAWTIPHQPMLLLGGFAGAALISAGSGVLALSQWNRFQDSLQQERNLLLVERLRSFGPAAQATPATPAPPTLEPPIATPANATGQVQAVASPLAAAATADDAGLPPPPPNEPWIEQLAELPQPQRSAPLLRVPVGPRLAAATSAPAPVRRRTPAGPLPLLVGVVAAPGKGGSAIFQMGGSTSTVGNGDSIGNSGWRLRSTDGDSVQIEHEGEIRRITIGSGG
jgi:hypothetical protein